MPLRSNHSALQDAWREERGRLLSLLQWSAEREGRGTFFSQLQWSAEREGRMGLALLGSGLVALVLAVLLLATMP